MKGPLRNMLVIGVGDAGSRLIGFFVTVYLARVLGVAAFGTISLGFSVLGYLGQLSGSGIQLVETRNAAAGATVDLRRVGTVTLLRVFVSLVVLAATMGFCFLFIGSSESRDAVWLSALSLIPLALSLDWFFQGREQFSALSASKIIHYAGYLVLVYVFVDHPGQFRWAPLAFAAGLLLSSVILLEVFRRQHGPLRLDVQTGVWREFVRTSLPLGAAMVAGQSAVNLAPIVIGILMTTIEVGMFSAAMKIVALILMLDRVLNVALLPLLSRLRMHRPAEVQTTISLVFKVVLLLVLPASVLGVLWAESGVLFIFGPGYDDAVPLLRILLGYVAITLPNSVLVCTLLAGGRERLYTRMLMVGSGLLALFVVILTMVFGQIGAAVGVVAGELTMFVMFLNGVRGLVFFDRVAVLLKPLVACLCMVGVIVILSGLHSAVGALAGATSYVLVILLLGVASMEDIRRLRRGLL